MCFTSPLPMTMLSRLILTAVMVGFLPTLMFAQASALDPGFGSSGKVITMVDTIGDAGNAIAIQSDNKIVVGGTSNTTFTTSDFALLRYNEDGSPDQTFGVGGKVTTFIESRSTAKALLIQNDGKIVLAGNAKWYLNMARYNSDGSLDNSFGNGGKVITDFVGFYNDKGNAVAIQSDGKILLAGSASHNGNDMTHFIMVRYHPDGSLDSTFGTNGQVIGMLGEASAMTLQSDGKILLGGTSDFSMAVERYHPDGTLDSTFGTNGAVVSQLGNSSWGVAMTLQNDGKILLAGAINAAVLVKDFALVRYQSDGSLDPAFGIGGVVTTAVGTSGRGNAVSVQGDGKILVAGEIKDSVGAQNFGLVRYQSTGGLDNAFGTAGVVITPVGLLQSKGYAMALHGNGKIVLSGYAVGSISADVALVRYQGDATIGIGDACCTHRESKVYPNPFTNETTIQLNEPLHSGELMLFNVYGQIVKQEANLSGTVLTLSRSDLPAGVYFLQVVEGTEVIAVDHLVISDR